MEKITGIALGAVLALSACMEQAPEWTRERQESVTSRTLSGVSSKQAMTAAEKVFRLADPRHTKFDYRDDGFVAERSAFIYFVIGADSTVYHFDVRAQDVAGGTRLTMRASQRSSTTTAAGILPSGGTLNRAEGLYALFFARINTLLGRSNRWITCDQAPGLIGTRPFHFEPLCIAAEDNRP